MLRPVIYSLTALLMTSINPTPSPSAPKPTPSATVSLEASPSGAPSASPSDTSSLAKNGKDSKKPVKQKAIKSSKKRIKQAFDLKQQYKNDKDFILAVDDPFKDKLVVMVRKNSKLSKKLHNKYDNDSTVSLEERRYSVEDMKNASAKIMKDSKAIESKNNLKITGVTSFHTENDYIELYVENIEELDISRIERNLANLTGVEVKLEKNTMKDATLKTEITPEELPPINAPRSTLFDHRLISPNDKRSGAYIIPTSSTNNQKLNCSTGFTIFYRSAPELGYDGSPKLSTARHCMDHDTSINDMFFTHAEEDYNNKYINLTDYEKNLNAKAVYISPTTSKDNELETTSGILLLDAKGASGFYKGHPKNSKRYIIDGSLSENQMEESSSLARHEFCTSGANSGTHCKLKFQSTLYIYEKTINLDDEYGWIKVYQIGATEETERYNSDFPIAAIQGDSGSGVIMKIDYENIDDEANYKNKVNYIPPGQYAVGMLQFVRQSPEFATTRLLHNFEPSHDDLWSLPTITYTEDNKIITKTKTESYGDIAAFSSMESIMSELKNKDQEAHIYTWDEEWQNYPSK